MWMATTRRGQKHILFWNLTARQAGRAFFGICGFTACRFVLKGLAIAC
jgi:hypothetical protein